MPGFQGQQAHFPASGPANNFLIILYILKKYFRKLKLFRYSSVLIFMTFGIWNGIFTLCIIISNHLRREEVGGSVFCSPGLGRSLGGELRPPRTIHPAFGGEVAIGCSGQVLRRVGPKLDPTGAALHYTVQSAFESAQSWAKMASRHC
jgi:hypothetical protein